MIDTEQFPLSCVRNGVPAGTTLCGYEQLGPNVLRIKCRDNVPPLFEGLGLGLLEDESLLFLLISGIELYIFIYGPEEIKSPFSVVELKKEGESTIIIEY